MFLYLTEEGNIRKAIWNGTGYATVPLAEGLATGDINSIVVGGADSLLFCPGTRQAGGKSVPCIVMVGMGDGARSNLDEAAKFNEDGRALTSDLQYNNGKLMARLADADGKVLNQWAVFDVIKRKYTVLDLSDFIKKHMAGWTEPVSLTVALTGENAALVICAAGGYAAPEATASDTAEKSPYECLAIPTDLAGTPTGEAVKVAGGESRDCCKLQYGMHFSASPDGKRLLFIGASGGVHVYDAPQNNEFTLYKDISAFTFTAWGRDGSVYYSAAKPAGGYLIYRCTAASQP